MAIQNFSVTPAGDMSAGLSGISKILQFATEKREEEAAEEEARAQKAAAQEALLDAWNSGDPSAVMEASINHPSIAAQATQGLGLLEQYQKDDANKFAMEVLANPEKAGEIAERRIQLLNMQDRNPEHTMQFYDAYLQDPEAALKGLELNFAAASPEGYKAYRETMTPEAADTKVVGDFLVDTSGKVIFDANAQGGGNTPEHGVTPLIFRNPQTGAYTAYLPAKDGTMTQVETPEGQEFVPDSGRLGFNPTNILEQGAAQTEAERIKNLPAAQRQQLRRQQQQTMLDETIDRAAGLTSGWTTGVGSWLQKVPGSDANDLRATLDTIKGNIGFDKLQEMREASPTGGALGAVSTFELQNLQSVLGNLEQSQSKDQFLFNLEQVRNTLRDIVHGGEMQFLDTYGGGQAAAPVQQGSVPAGGGQVLRFDTQGNLIQ
jgi:hypothetical protein